MKRARTALLLLPVTVMLALAGCASAEGGGGGDDDQIVVGYSGYTLTNPFFAGLVKGLEDGADAHGYTLITTNSNGDNNAQVTDVQNLISQGADYIIICPGDGKAIVPAVNQAVDAGIPVLAIADTIDSDRLATTITPDHVEIGTLGAQALVDFLTDKYGEPRGKIVNMQGAVGVPATNYREEGFQGVISKYPDIEVVATADGGFDTDKTFQALSSILQAHPDIDAVFTANDGEAQGATKAIEAAGLFHKVGEEGHIFVNGNDAPPPTIADIRAGRQDVSVSQQPIKMAMAAMDNIALLASGEEVPKLITWPVQVISLENIDSPEVLEYGIWADEVGN